MQLLIISIINFINNSYPFPDPLEYTTVSTFLPLLLHFSLTPLSARQSITLQGYWLQERGGFFLLFYFIFYNRQSFPPRNTPSKYLLQRNDNKSLKVNLAAFSPHVLPLKKKKVICLKKKNPKPLKAQIRNSTYMESELRINLL